MAVLIFQPPRQIVRRRVSARRRIAQRLRYHDAFDVTQHPLGIIDQSAAEDFLLMGGGGLVGTVGRGQHGNDDTDDGDGNDHADRHHDAQPRAVPTRRALPLECA